MKRIFLVLIIIILATPAFADNNIATEVENNNYLNMGSGGGTLHSQTEANTQMAAPSLPLTVTNEYNGPVFEDHKVQTDILNFILGDTPIRAFDIIKEGFGFTISTAESKSKCITMKKFLPQKKVYIFKNKAELKKYQYKTIGYIDTYSDGDADLMNCFNQAIVDTGNMGGNALLLLKHNFTAGVTSTTVGLGSSGTAGFLHGGAGASAYGAAIGYASNTALPETNPYIHGIALWVEERK